MLKKIALVVGIMFFLLGLAGFMPGLSSYDNSNIQYLFGIFAIDWPQSAIRIAIGLAGVAVALNMAASKIYLIATGALCAIIALIGFQSSTLFGFTHFNMADSWSHAVLAIIILGLGFGVHPDYELKLKKTAKTK